MVFCDCSNEASDGVETRKPISQMKDRGGQMNKWQQRLRGVDDPADKNPWPAEVQESG